MNTVALLPGSDWDPAGGAAALRRRVFVDGQGVDPAVELDDLDWSTSTVHAIVTSETGAVVATGRCVDPGGLVTSVAAPSASRAGGVARGRVGRMAVDAAVRGRGLGRQVLEALESAARSRGLVGIELHAQTHARGFYAGAGYEAVGATYLEQGIEHVSMQRSWLPGLRPVRPSEALAVQDLIGGCFAEYPGCVLDLDDLDAWMLAPASRPLLVLPSAVLPGELDGCVCVGSGSELKSLYVRAAARKRGYGTSLVHLAVRCGARELWTDSRFLDAHRLYERLGWVRQPATRQLHDPSMTTELLFRLA